MEPPSRGKRKSEDQSAYDLSAVLLHYGGDVPGGSGWCKFRCPVHGERRASATVNLDIGMMRCFSCDFSGDAIKLIRQMDSCGFREALVKYAEITGVPLDSVTTKSYAPAGAAEGKSYEDGSSFLVSRLKGKNYV